MKRLAGTIILLAWTCTGRAERVVEEFDWSQSPWREAIPQLATLVTNAGGRASLEIRSTNTSGLRVLLLKIEAPAISNALYAVRGEVRYQEVRGNGFLEMWNHFPPLKPGMPEGQYFSRTLGESGDMGKIRGTSDWRRFSLPFDWTGASGPPTHLEVALILPSSGSVWLGPMQLVEFSAAVGSDAGAGRASRAGGVAPWWPNHAAGWVGGLLGSVIGGLGGLIGWLGSKGRARAFVLGTLRGLIGFGILLLSLAVLAISRGQPLWVWAPLLGTGVLLVTILPSLLRDFRHRYEARELRRMEAVDLVSR